ncbi:Asparagine synthetase domain-containing protein 1, partial [Spiromyces aspiralis]
SVVKFLSSLPIHLKMDLRYKRGVGDKLLLRLLAYRMGMTNASRLAKRAIQFGARTAKMETGKDRGQDVIL